MKLATQFLTLRPLSILATCAALTACGGGGGNTTASGGAPVATASDATPPVAADATTTTAAASTLTAATITSSTIANAVPITDVRIQNTDASTVQTNTPFTFGQVFVPGQVSPSDVLVGRLDDGTAIPLQMDVKATNPDGSVRHAIVSGILPSVAVGAQRTVSLVKGGTASPSTGTVSNMMKAGFTTSFHAKINGVDYYASADDLLKTAVPTTWLKGAVVNEWQVAAPLHTADGTVHPHLSARFAVRWYDSIKKARVDVTVENDWAYEPGPQNFTYDASILVGGNTVYNKPALTHLHHARWRKIFWFNGSEPAINIKHNAAYLISTRALPNYDQSISFPESVLAAFQAHWGATNNEPMGSGLIAPYMPMTGGRDDIGLLPNWAATYLLTQDSRMKEMTLRTADLAGSFSAHYRDKNTGRPISLADYPYMTIMGRATDTLNPATQKYESFPDCGGSCDTPYMHDGAHQPSMAYLPYLVTGDYYYLEELQFWAMWDAFSSNPGYRQGIKGLVQSDQVRGQAWEMRTLGEAAYISPDKDTLKATFVNVVNNNLDWYNSTYTNNASANQLGVLVNNAIVYGNGVGLAPWQDDFFTSAIGHVAELGFTNAKQLLAWKAKFPTGRMIGDGVCWIDGAIYDLTVSSAPNGPLFTTIGEAYQASHSATIDALPCGSAAMATTLGAAVGESLQVGQMTGYSDSVVGFPSNMQPALAYAADVSSDGKAAWAKFMSRTAKPNYANGPQFAIVPR